VQSTTTGAIVKRPGVTTITPSAAPTNLKTVFAVQAVTSNSHYLAMSDSAVYKVTKPATTWDFTDLTVSGIGTQGRWAVVEATADGTQGPVFLSNGIVSKAWDGTSMVDWTMDSASTLLASGSAVPPHTISIVHESRIVIASGSTIYWSEVQVGVGTKPRTWLLENQQLFDPNDGDVITGLGRVGSNLIVFKKHKVFVVYDLNTGATRRLTSNIGCVSPNSVVETPMGTIFLSENGVYITDGSSAQLMSDVITPTVRALSDPANSSAVLYRNHYYLSSGSDVLDYDLTLKSWWKHSFKSGSIADFTTRFDGAAEQLHCISANKVGRMFDDGVFTDFGLTYSWKWAGPWLSPGQARMVYPAVRKRLKALRIDGKGLVGLKLGHDFADDSSAQSVTAQNPDGSISQSLFPRPTSTTFAPASNDGTYFGDYITGGTGPVTLIAPTYFSDYQSWQQARVWGQGVSRAWSLIFSDYAADTSAAIIENYTIFTQERNQ